MKKSLLLFCLCFFCLTYINSVNATDLQAMINDAPNDGTVTINSAEVVIGGTISINKNLIIKSSNAGMNTNIGSNSNRVFVGFKIGDNCKVSFKNLNFMGFKNYAISSGDRTVLSFDKCGFSSSRGGVDSRSSKLSFDNCEFANNFNNSVLKTIGDELTLINCNFKSNNYVGGSGSCINGMNSNVSIDKCVFNGNHADIRGGSISLDGVYDCSVSGSSVDGNSANGGGFLYTTGKNYNVKLLSSSFSNNRAVGHDSGSSVNGVGGVILSTTTTTATGYNYLLSGNSISNDNVADSGGGLLACFREGGTFTFNGNTFADSLWFRNSVCQIEAGNNVFEGV